MKHRLLTAVSAVMAISSTAFGADSVFYTEGFDSQADMDKWAITTTQSPALAESKLWHIGSSGYEELNASSKNSLGITLAEEDNMVTEIVSPLIDCTGRAGLVAGFSGYNTSGLYAWAGLYIRFYIKDESATEWEQIYYAGTGNDLTETDLWNWKRFRKELPASYDGKKVRFKILVECTSDYGNSTRQMWFDDIYLAEKPEYEAKATAIEPSLSASMTPVPVSISILNNGSKPFSNFKIYYTIDGGSRVEQTVTETMNPGETKTFEFNQKAAFTEIGRTYRLKAGVDLTNDADRDNDAMETDVVNTIVRLPYTPNIPDRNNTDFWQTPRAQTEGDWSIYQDRSAGRCYWQSTIYRNGNQQDGLLISRPIYMDAATLGSVEFQTWLSSSSMKGGLEAYLATDPADSSKWTRIYQNAEFSATTSARIDAAASFTSPADGVYYIIFKSISPTNSSRGTLYLDVLQIKEAPDYDLALSGFISPAKTAPEYSETETVTVKISNQGKLSASGAKITLIVDGREIAKENLPAIAAGSGIDYTFTAKADLTGGTSGHTLEATIIWPEDLAPGNNSASLKVLADIAEAPYTIDTYSNDFETNWIAEDLNKDGKTFILEDIYSNHRFAYNSGNDTIPTTDEMLYSREIKLRAGKTYRVSPRMVIEGEDDNSSNTYKMALGLYKETDGKMTLVKNIGEKEIRYWNTHHFLTTVDETAKYRVGIRLSKETPAAYYARLTEFSIVEAGETDLQADRMYLSGNIISGIHKALAKIRVRNNGLKPVSRFKIRFSSPTLGEKSQEFELEKPVETTGYATVRFAEELNLDIKENEQLTAEVICEGDNVESNNKIYKQLIRKAPLQTPVSIATTPDQGWMTFDRNGNDMIEEGYYDNYVFDARTEGDTPNQLYSPAINLKAGKNYRITFNYNANYLAPQKDALNILLENVADGSRIKVAAIVNEENGYNWQSAPFTAYASVPADGTYSVLFEDNVWPGLEPPQYSSPEVSVSETLEVCEAETLPDMKLLAITSPAADGTYSASETVKVSYRNNGTVDVVPATFLLNVGEKTYGAVITGGVKAGTDGEIEFKGVDLYTPGEYTLTASTANGADATPADNSTSISLRSNPVVDAAITSIDGPLTGDLGKHEHVVATITNLGKGDLADFPVSYTLTRENGGTPVTVTETVEGPLADGESLKYTFKADADFSVEGNYTIEVKVELDGDVNADNNKVSTKIGSSHADMDAGVDAIVGPTRKLMTAEENIVISVRNYGQSDIFDVPVKATVKRGDQTVATVEGSVAEIPAGKSVEYTFATPVDLRQGGDYTVEAATVLNRDVNPDNDSFTGTIYAFMIDCGVDAIISPKAECPAGDQKITVSIRNFGDAPIGNIPVLFKLGNNPQSGTYEGTIQPGETAEYTFASTYKFREGREYTLTAYTAHPDDMNPDNDQCALDIKGVSGVSSAVAERIEISSAAGTIVIDGLAQGDIIKAFDAAGRLVAGKEADAPRTEIHTGSGIFMLVISSRTEGNLTLKINVR